MSEQGIVKWYSLARGYGFIRREHGGDSAGEALGENSEEVFVHHSEVPGDSLAEGERVSFEIVDGPKGLNARNVRRVSSSASTDAGVVGIALAGGQSRRMGRDKAGLLVGGTSLLESAISRLRAVTPDVLVADRGLALAPAHRSVDDGPGAGPAAGILGAAAARPDHDLLVLACDLPGVPEALLRHLAEPIAEHACIPRWSRGSEPLCALYRPAALAVMAAEVRAGRLALHAMLRRDDLRVRYLEGDLLAKFGPPERIFLNLNSPEDLRTFQAGE